MAQWEQVKCLPGPSLSELYPPEFPMEVRYYLSIWIEEQHWDEIDVDNPSQEPQALLLLNHIVSSLHTMAQQKSNVVERLRLQDISMKMKLFHSQPLLLVKTVQGVLRQERDLLAKMAPSAPHFVLPPAQQPCPPAPSPLPATEGATGKDSSQDVDLLFHQLVKAQKYREAQRRMLSLQDSELSGQLENEVQALSMMRAQLLQEVLIGLERCQEILIHKIQDWRREQHLSTIGNPFNEDLSPLQTLCEQLLEVNLTLREEVLLLGRDCGGEEQIKKPQERLELLLQTLIQNSLVVDKQPPQVIKTQSKFSTSVRLLLGEKRALGRPMQLKAQIITEMQARNLTQSRTVPKENVGELVSNTAIMEHNACNKTTCASFRNMCIKKIKRADRRGAESVTEEKFAIHFSGEVNISGSDVSCRVQTLSFPVVVIVHGSQDINAMATVTWDCAFSDPDRLPFVVPDRVPWKQMCKTLDSKFMSEVQTQRGLEHYNHHFLAQKIFNKADHTGDFSNMLVSWSQFNKEVLPGRPFTFWQWFDGVMELTKKHLRQYWSDSLISGFIGKQHLHVILQDKPNGTFLLRFSDSEIGGITIAYVTLSENGGRKIQNIQPFTKKDLEIRCLGDRIRDIESIMHLYPNLPKNDVFKKYYTDEQRVEGRGYIGVSIRTKVAEDPTTVKPQNDISQEMPCLSPYPPDNVYPSQDPALFYHGSQIPFQNSSGGVFMTSPGTLFDQQTNNLFPAMGIAPTPEPSLQDMDLELDLFDTDMYGVQQ